MLGSDKVALSKSLEVWTWVAQEVGRDKMDYPNFGEYAPIHGCFLCERRREVGDPTSLRCSAFQECYNNCFISWVSQNNRDGEAFPGDGDYLCENVASVYRKWRDAYYHRDLLHLAHNYAKRIVNLHKIALGYSI